MPEWTISGSYVASCACQMICPCPVGEHPTGPKGQCLGGAVFNVKSGKYGDVDLAGVAFAFYNRFPTVAREGNWTIGLVVDDSANDKQVEAIDQIISGKQGGPFAEWVALVAEYKGVEKAKIVVDDKVLTASVAGHSEFSIDAYKGADGAPTTVRNAPGGAALEFKIGKAAGHTSAIGDDYDVNYGEAADFEYSSQMGREEIHIRTR